MQAMTSIKRVLSRPVTYQMIRAASTTRYVNSYNKSTSPTNSFNNKTTAPNKKAVEEPKEEGSKKNITSEIDTNQEFPATKQFDSGTLDDPEGTGHNWNSSFFGLSTERFSREISDILLEPLKDNDIEIKPDGLLYLPEIKYRRILNRAFGPGGWGLAPRGDHTISPKNISREYALVCHGRFISQARGEQDYFDISGLPTATEGCKSNALMRCCKDLGVASELWDPVFIRKYKKKYCVEVWAEHVTTKKKKKLWRKKDDVLEYPYKEN